MRFSECFNLPHNHQENFDFVNIRIDSDNKLFIDPTRIRVEDSNFFQKYNVIIQDFFNTIFDLYSNGETSRAKQFFRSSGESNEIYLGYTEGFPRGNGNSEESLTKIFDYVHSKGLLNDNIVGRIEDFHVFIPDFGKDLLSDLVASLIKAELIYFTQGQCEKYGITLSHQFNFPYWDHKSHDWKQGEELLPEYNGYPIVLLPKDIVVSKYIYDANRYWAQVVSVWRQERHRDADTDLHRNRPEREDFASKKEIRREEIKEKNISEKEYLIDMTRENFEMIERFRANIENTQRGTNSNKMLDEELEKFIEESYELAE
ncbi:hypothetical protein HF072_04475 [Bacillus sp. RO3]|nr:hypothetical protein [Bacillus sp. RO3]